MNRRRSHRQTHGIKPFSGSRFVAGGKVWIEWWPNGKRQARIVGTNDKKTRDLADAILADALAVARARASGVPEAPTALTLGELFRRYLEDAKHRTAGRTGEPLRPPTLERYAQYHQVLMAAFDPAREAASLTRQDVRAFIRNAQQSKSGRGVTKRLVDHLRQVYKWAVSEEECLEADPIAGVKSPAHKAETLPYTREEARRLYEALLRPRADVKGRPVNTDWRFRAVGLLIVIYGVRESQARELRWGDVDLDAMTTVEGVAYHGAVTFRQATRGSKGQKDRTLPLHPAVRTALVAAHVKRLDEDPRRFVCWNQRAPAEPTDYESMQRQLHALEVRENVATIKGRAWHALRRALMTFLVEELGVAQAAALTGDSPDVILKTYVKVSKEAVGEAMQAVAKAFPAPVKKGQEITSPRLKRDSQENVEIGEAATA